MIVPIFRPTTMRSLARIPGIFFDLLSDNGMSPFCMLNNHFVTVQQPCSYIIFQNIVTLCTVKNKFIHKEFTVNV